MMKQNLRATTRKRRDKSPAGGDTKPVLYSKPGQWCLKRFVCPYMHGHLGKCLDGFGINGRLSPANKPKVPVGFAESLPARDFAGARRDRRDWTQNDNDIWDGEYPENNTGIPTSKTTGMGIPKPWFKRAETTVSNYSFNR